VQSPEDTVAASTDVTDRPSPSPRRRRPLHARIAPSGPKRRPVAEIIHSEQQDTAPPLLSQSAPKTVSAIIKANEGAAPPPPKGVAVHQWPPQRGPPSPLPTFIKFADLKAAGIVNNHCALKILIDDHNFPKGRWLGSATHVWTLNEVEQWLANRPVERPVPNASDKGRR
jgi:Prophage CP4-57 regulatory protein (AlpA)